MKSLSSITSIESYVSAFSNDLAEKVAQQSEPLHTPAPGNQAWPLKRMATKLFDKQQDLVTGCVKSLQENHLAILACQMGTGKAQPNHSPVLTPTGWRSIGSIRVGDQVCTPDGNTAKVIGVFPQGRKDVKKVTFTDGSSTLCCDEHLWQVTTPDRKHRKAPPMVKSLGELERLGLKLKNGNLKYYIPMTKSVGTECLPYPAMKPYLLGYLIGNGCLTSNVRVCIPDDETAKRLAEIIYWGYPELKLKRKTADSIDYSITGKKAGVPNQLMDELKEYGLMRCHSDTKFIPFNSLHQDTWYRESLLQGLLDSDGSVEANANSIEYSTASEQLSRDVVALVQSLGGVATVTTKVPTFTYKGVKKKGLLSYRIMICLPNDITPFKLCRKAVRYKPRTKYNPTRGMMKIEKAGNFECTCIRLDSKAQLYITDDYIVTHNTPQGIATVHCHALRNVKESPAVFQPAYRAMVLCPPHLVTKWRSEIYKFLGNTIKVVIITTWQEFLALRYLPKPTGSEWYIMAMTTAKLGYDRRCAGIRKIVTIETDAGPMKHEAFVCSRCNYPAYNHKKLLATQKNIEDGWIKCIGKWCKKCGVSKQHDYKVCMTCGSDLAPCAEPLWQGRSHKVSPVQYVKSTGVQWFDYFIRDEVHESKGADSMDGHAACVFSAHAKYTILMTGTLLAGKSEDLRPLLFRLKPRAFKEMGYGWKDEIPFAEAYGRIQTVVRSSSGGGGGTKRRSGTGSSKSTTRDVKPGIMPQLFPDFVSNYTVFMSLTELAINLPSYHEETQSIAMDPMMKAHYDKMKKTCLDRFRYLYQNNRKMAVKILGPMLEAFMTWPDVPYGRKPVGYTDDSGNFNTIYVPADMDQTTIYPKEQALLDYIKQEKALGRKCWVFSVRDDVRDRLQIIMEAHGLKVATLKATVKPSTRIDWIAKQAPVCDVGLSHPQLVETGLELFGPGFNFPTLLWYSTGFRLNTLRQASRRSWRIGQPKDCKTVYLYYGDSAQHTAVGVMAAKLVAAEAIEGKFSDGGLADESTDEDVALSVARHMADNIRVEVQSRYKPIEAGSSGADRIQLMRNKFASLSQKMKKYQLS